MRTYCAMTVAGSIAWLQAQETAMSNPRRYAILYKCQNEIEESVRFCESTAIQIWKNHSDVMRSFSLFQVPEIEMLESSDRPLTPLQSRGHSTRVS